MYGARPLRRFIARDVEPRLGHMLLAGTSRTTRPSHHRREQGAERPLREPEVTGRMRRSTGYGLRPVPCPCVRRASSGAAVGHRRSTR
ncbi:hypothetical protein [Actinomadura nitritigenes]|uniref:hypothetical protein n=1 Tax=Actinomadura nitritigenes TaxID=134602 RepID=UPI0027DB4670|nr:hypothetical protein [Actinomadura nitritigenes]